MQTFKIKAKVEKGLKLDIFGFSFKRVASISPKEQETLAIRVAGDWVKKNAKLLQSPLYTVKEYAMQDGMLNVTIKVGE